MYAQPSFYFKTKGGIVHAVMQGHITKKKEPMKYSKIVEHVIQALIPSINHKEPLRKKLKYVYLGISLRLGNKICAISLLTPT